MESKKGLGSVVAISLLIIVSVFAVISFQSWYHNFQNNIITQTEQKSFGNSIKIETIINNELFLINSLEQDITIKKILIDNVECNINKENLSFGINTISLENCIENINNSINEILVITNNNIYSKKIFLKQIINTTHVSISTCTLPNSSEVVDGWSGIFYLEESTSNCQNETRYCDSGNLNGSYQYLQCNEVNFGNDEYTVLLMHMDDEQLTDNSLGKTEEHNVTLIGDISRSSTQSVFGGYSAYFDGAGDYLSIPDSQDWYFGNGDFTVDLWAYPQTPGTIIEQRDGAYGSIGIYFTVVEMSGVNYWRIGVYTGAAYYGSFNVVTAQLNTWSHLALVRNGSIVKAYLNGNEMPAGAASTNMETSLMNDATTPLFIGWDNYWNGLEFKGYIDELRLSKGIARWTNNFDIPQIPYN